MSPHLADLRREVRRFVDARHDVQLGALLPDVHLDRVFFLQLVPQIVAGLLQHL